MAGVSVFWGGFTKKIIEILFMIVKKEVAKNDSGVNQKHTFFFFTFFKNCNPRIYFFFSFPFFNTLRKHARMVLSYTNTAIILSMQFIAAFYATEAVTAFFSSLRSDFYEDFVKEHNEKVEIVEKKEKALCFKQELLEVCSNKLKKKQEKFEKIADCN